MFIAIVAIGLIMPAAALGQCVVFDKPQDLYEMSAVVFLGTATADEPTGAGGEHVMTDVATLRVDQIWKGHSAKELRVASDAPFVVGQQYLVFAGGQPLAASIRCRSAEPIDRAIAKLDWLNTSTAVELALSDKYGRAPYYTGGHAGVGAGGSEGPWETLTVRCCGRPEFVVLVTKGNPTFDREGSRRRLLLTLYSWHDELEAAAKHPQPR